MIKNHGCIEQVRQSNYWDESVTLPAVYCRILIQFYNYLAPWVYKGFKTWEEMCEDAERICGVAKGSYASEDNFHYIFRRYVRKVACSSPTIRQAIFEMTKKAGITFQYLLEYYERDDDFPLKVVFGKVSEAMHIAHLEWCVADYEEVKKYVSPDDYSNGSGDGENGDSDEEQSGGEYSDGGDSDDGESGEEDFDDAEDADTDNLEDEDEEDK